MDRLLMLADVDVPITVTHGGDAPIDGSTTIIIEDGPRCDGAEIVVNSTSGPRDAEVKNSFGDIIGWLDPGVTLLQQIAPHRRQRP
ncbi:unnamed protein product [Aphis gossypii]|uniref:Uncharacterized protein n=1 Tax=Aphis gossypii TaxID=80765 RepID=A0A9P0NM21_APHGO|nr:unnamed protein product [Aphis gossypii]